MLVTIEDNKLVLAILLYENRNIEGVKEGIVQQFIFPEIDL